MENISINDFASRRKDNIRNYSDVNASKRRMWREKNAFFHEEDLRYLKYLIPSGARILEIGCGNGDLIASLSSTSSVGVDISGGMIDEAKNLHPDVTFFKMDVEDKSRMNEIKGTFDVILVVDTIGYLDDVQGFLESLHSLCTKETRIIISYFSHLWWPILKLTEVTGFKTPSVETTALSLSDLQSLADLSKLDLVRSEYRLLCPVSLGGIGRLINRFLAPLPFIRHLALRHYSIYRSLEHIHDASPTSVSIVIPARNEKGNIEIGIKRIPNFVDDIEIIFVEGNSADGTWDEIQRVIKAYPELDIKAYKQPGKGKADAVFYAFDRARGDVLMILDADLTMPPEQLPKYWSAISSGSAEFVNGSRLIYPMENGAMRFLNLVANRGFSIIFSWLLNQKITDTLCGTKVISNENYQRLKAGRSYFGDFDPFGDFDLIFGATKLNLRIKDIPIRYANRLYGETQISRFRHGLMLLKMVVFAFFRLKAL